MKIIAKFSVKIKGVAVSSISWGRLFGNMIHRAGDTVAFIVCSNSYKAIYVVSLATIYVQKQMISPLRDFSLLMRCWCDSSN